MPQNSLGLHHFHLRKRIHQKREKFPSPRPHIHVMDMIIYGAVIAGPLFNIPQLLKIWKGNDATGVSITSWFGFSLISIIWLSYGIIHKEKPIIITNAILIIIQLSVAIGALLYS